MKPIWKKIRLQKNFNGVEGVKVSSTEYQLQLGFGKDFNHAKKAKVDKSKVKKDLEKGKQSRAKKSAAGWNSPWWL